jgi:hypothetical protein
MFVNLQTPEQRLSTWRDIRNKNHSNIEEVLEDFSSIKLVSRYLDYYTPKSWPNPFEIVNQGYFCQSGVSLVLASTLVYKNFLFEDKIIYPVISNNITGNSGLVILHDNLVYNFTPNKVESWDFVKENSTVFQIHNLEKNKIIS